MSNNSENLPANNTESLVENISALVNSGATELAVKTFKEFHPVDQASAFAEISNDEKLEILSLLELDDIAAFSKELDPVDAARLANLVSNEVFAKVLDLLPPEDVADILHALPANLSETILLELKDSVPVANLLIFPDDSAGGLMSPLSFVVNINSTVGVTLEGLRAVVEKSEGPGVLFVVDPSGKPIGYLGIKRIVLSRTAERISNLMRPLPASVNTYTDQEECALLMERYDLAELAVTNQQGQLVGVISSNDLSHIAAAEATEDMFRMAGIPPERTSTSVRQAFRSRAPWLTINLATTFVAAGVISIFESTIGKVAILAVFLPVVAGQGGIGGTQTLTLVVRSMALGEFSGRRGKRVLIREATIGLLNGVFLGILVTIVAAAWQQNLLIGTLLGVAMFGNMIVAGIVGSGIPILLRRFKLDPAVSSAVLVTTVTDVLGFLLFLGLATAILDMID